MIYQCPKPQNFPNGRVQQKHQEFGREAVRTRRTYLSSVAGDGKGHLVLGVGIADATET